MTQKLGITDLEIGGNTVLMRVDFNVPLDKNANITDDTRIVESLPSIKYVLEHGGALILMSHLGRPKGKPLQEYSLAPCVKRLSELLGTPVVMAPDCVGDQVAALAKALKPGQVLMLENLRFHDAEEHPEKDPSFARQLASLGDLYVNDAFGSAHRAHSSTAEIARYFPGKAAAGFLMEKEIRFLGAALANPKRPFYAIIGGAKVSSKIGVLRSLLSKVDALLIGGGMAFTFLKAQGIAVGNSLVEEALVEEARQILVAAAKARTTLLLPVDCVVAAKITPDAHGYVVSLKEGGIPEGQMGVDIGPETVALFSAEIARAATIFWNGPMGVFEISEFAAGTNGIAKAIARSDAVSIVGGGDSVAALQKGGFSEAVTHISTGGGASLEYIEFGKLPGIEALSDAKAPVK